MGTMNRKPPTFWVVYLSSLVVAALGCIPGQNNGGGDGETDISGNVGGQSFSVASASADRGEQSVYVVTLADTPDFSCSASSGLPMNYLQIVVGDIEESGTYDADGRVFFNVFENGVSEGEAATTGTVTIDTVSFGFIDGNIDASGPRSSVEGNFSAEVCN
jgi:hypothetical protein